MIKHSCFSSSQKKYMQKGKPASQIPRFHNLYYTLSRRSETHDSREATIPLKCIIHVQPADVALLPVKRFEASGQLRQRGLVLRKASVSPSLPSYPPTVSFREPSEAVCSLGNAFGRTPWVRHRAVSEFQV